MLEEITKLDKNANPENLIYRYKGSTVDEKFNKFDNAFSLFCVEYAKFFWVYFKKT